VISRINSTAQIGRLNRVVRRKEAGEAWWLAGGIDPSDCVAAYQAKGAASYAASLVNLANPGTYDAYEGVTPSWGAADGWTFNGSTQYLVTDVVPKIQPQSWSALIYQDGGLGFSLHGTAPSSYREFGFRAINATTMRFHNGMQKDATVSSLTGIFGIAGAGAYIDGILIGGDIPVWPASPCGKIHIGRNIRDASGFYNGKIIAVAIYNTVLTSAQMAALTIAMNAL
jgi:hypothetical protein